MSQYCRLCLSFSKNLMTAFIQVDRQCFSSLIQQFCGFQIYKSDVLSKKICHTCFKVIWSMFKLRKQSLVNDERLKLSGGLEKLLYLNQNNKTVQNANVKVKEVKEQQQHQVPTFEISSASEKAQQQIEKESFSRSCEEKEEVEYLLLEEVPTKKLRRIPRKEKKDELLNCTQNMPSRIKINLFKPVEEKRDPVIKKTRRQRKVPDMKGLQRALKAVRSGEASIRGASKLYGVSRSTIDRHLKGKDLGGKRISKRILTEAEESYLAEQIVDSSLSGIPPTDDMIIKYATIIINSRENPPNPPIASPSSGWVRKFLGRHYEDITKQTQEILSDDALESSEVYENTSHVVDGVNHTIKQLLKRLESVKNLSISSNAAVIKESDEDEDEKSEEVVVKVEENSDEKTIFIDQIDIQKEEIFDYPEVYVKEEIES